MLSSLSCKLMNSLLCDCSNKLDAGRAAGRVSQALHKPPQLHQEQAALNRTQILLFTTLITVLTSCLLPMPLFPRVDATSPHLSWLRVKTRTIITPQLYAYDVWKLFRVSSLKAERGIPKLLWYSIGEIVLTRFSCSFQVSRCISAYSMLVTDSNAADASLLKVHNSKLVSGTTVTANYSCQSYSHHRW